MLADGPHVVVEGSQAASERGPERELLEHMEPVPRRVRPVAQIRDEPLRRPPVFIAGEPDDVTQRT
jgi:hypothetical protein